MPITNHQSPITAVLILGHGSPVKEANNTLYEVAESVQAKGGYDIVQPAFLQFEHPNFAEAVDILVNKGTHKIIVNPYFLYMGAHVSKDLPAEIDTARKRYPNLEFFLTSHLGFHEKLVEVAVERIEGAISDFGFRISNLNLTSHIPHPSSIKTHPIEKESFRIIGEQLDESRFSSRELPIVKRVIHATADFEYADLIRFSNNAIEAGLDAISKGAAIITDVRMIEVGISKERVGTFGGEVRCFVADRDVALKAKENNMTKTAAAIQKASDFIQGSIVVIGNAPTALRELIRLVKEKNLRPSLIIGVPVGFVDAEESKEELMSLDIPYISIKGKKGGSTVAVAMVNALLIIADANNVNRDRVPYS